MLGTANLLEDMKILVVPTIRENCINEFLNKWNHNLVDEIIVVEDNPTKTFNLPIKHHYSWKEIHEELGENDIIISKRDSSIKCFGFLKSYQLGAEYTFVLDDDCYPHTTASDFFNDHIQQFKKPQWINSVDGQHFRGLPYFNKGQLNNIVLNVGLWKGILDQDAPYSLVKPLTDDVIPDGSKIMPNGQYVNICGMNFCFKREIAVLTYFPLMGEGQPFRRFDDIFFGVIVKKICDHLRLNISIGEPFIYHSKASNVFDNLVKEATGIRFNEVFWEIINDVKLIGDTPKQCMLELGEELQNYSNTNQTYTDYIQNLGKSIVIWCSYF